MKTEDGNPTWQLTKGDRLGILTGHIDRPVISFVPGEADGKGDGYIWVGNEGQRKWCIGTLDGASLIYLARNILKDQGIVEKIKRPVKRKRRAAQAA